MKESTVNRYIREGLKGYPILLTRIESSVGNGVPDITYCSKTGHGWIETKYIREYPKRETTKIKLPLRPEQKLWIKTRGSLGGNVWVLCKIGDVFFLLTHEQAVRACDGWTTFEWFDNSHRVWEKGISFVELKYNLDKYN
jgi:hypothetical protein